MISIFVKFWTEFVQCMRGKKLFYFSGHRQAGIYNPTSCQSQVIQFHFQKWLYLILFCFQFQRNPCATWFVLCVLHVLADQSNHRTCHLSAKSGGFFQSAHGLHSFFHHVSNLLFVNHIEKQSTVELPDVCAQNFQCPLVFLACKLKFIVSENLLAWLVSWIFKSLCGYWKQTHCKYSHVIWNTEDWVKLSSAEAVECFQCLKSKQRTAGLSPSLTSCKTPFIGKPMHQDMPAQEMWCIYSRVLRKKPFAQRFGAQD